MMERGFEIVSAYLDQGINLPKRSTKNSAGYDIEAAEDVIISPFKVNATPVLIPTGIKAFFPSNEFLLLANRSSGPKKGIVAANGIGIIDADYYNNENNEGHIYFQCLNITDQEITIHKGDRIGQVIFINFNTCNDLVDNVRDGGFGSTDK